MDRLEDAKCLASRSVARFGRAPFVQSWQGLPRA